MKKILFQQWFYSRYMIIKKNQLEFHFFLNISVSELGPTILQSIDQKKETVFFFAHFKSVNAGAYSEIRLEDGANMQSPPLTL